MITLELIRARAVKFMALFIAVHVLLILAIGLLLDTHLTAPAIGALVTAIVCGSAAWKAPHHASTRMLLAVGIVVMVSLIVLQFEGHPWQIDVHMYYFACLATLTILCDIRAVIAATVAIAFHHLGLNFAFPALGVPRWGGFRSGHPSRCDRHCRGGDHWLAGFIHNRQCLQLSCERGRSREIGNWAFRPGA